MMIMNEDKFSELEKNKRLIERKPDNSLICNRCRMLKSQRKLLEYDPSLEGSEAGKPQKLSSHVANFDREEIVRNIFKKIFSRSIIIYVIDITNFEGSQI
jgi:hypothetical protein